MFFHFFQSTKDPKFSKIFKFFVSDAKIFEIPMDFHDFPENYTTLEVRISMTICPFIKKVCIFKRTTRDTSNARVFRDNSRFC